MVTGTPDGADSPASLYGPVALVLGVVTLLTAVLSGFLGIAIPLLTGSLAVTFGVLGLTSKLNRGRSAVGLVTGCLGLLYPIFIIVAGSA